MTGVPDARNKPLRVAGFIGTRLGTPSADRRCGCADDAEDRLLVDGELAWVHGPRRQELATWSSIRT